MPVPRAVPSVQVEITLTCEFHWYCVEEAVVPQQLIPHPAAMSIAMQSLALRSYDPI